MSCSSNRDIVFWAGLRGDRGVSRLPDVLGAPAHALGQNPALGQKEKEKTTQKEEVVMYIE